MFRGQRSFGRKAFYNSIQKDMVDSIPSKLGKYDVREEIARGSMGIVFLGHDPYIDRPVALKVALADSLNDPESGERYRKMFFNEAHTAGLLTHPNIINIFDAGVDEDTLKVTATLKIYCLSRKSWKSYSNAQRHLIMRIGRA